MNKYIVYSLLAACTLTAFNSCSDDDLSSTSVITGKKRTQNDFDKWLYTNFVLPYNVEIQYLYEDNESDMKQYDVPADSAQSVELAHLIKYTCAEAYDQVGGVPFTRKYFPKLFSFLGEFEYENNNTMKLGTAEGGKKIRMIGVNHLNKYLNNLPMLNELYLKTIHHEFVHILNQTKDYPREFDQVTGNSYVNDSWSSDVYVTGYLKRGFITAYSQKEAREDFAEMVSTYIISSKSQWNSYLAKSLVTDEDGKVTDRTGYDALLKKLEICKRYYKETFNIDLDELRDEVVRRENDVVNGYVSLTDLTVNN